MPHVIVKLWPGRTEAQKQALTEGIVRTVTETLGVPEQAVSVGVEEIPRERWAKEVYEPDILAKAQTITRQSAYKPPEP